MPSNIQAAMAYGQFKRLKELLSIKRNIFNEYKKTYQKLKFILILIIRMLKMVYGQP